MRSTDDIRRPGRVMVVDDQPDLCWVLARVLSARGHQVRTAGDGVQARRLASAFDCQVAIVDYRLPDVSGIVLVRALRATLPNLRAILMTSYGTAALREEARRCGFEAYVDKPLRNADLVALVEAALPVGEPA